VPINPQIILGGTREAVKINTTFENLDVVMQARQHQLDADKAQREQRAAARAEQESLQVRAILERTQGDWETALPQIRRVAPGASLEIEKQLGAARKQRADSLKAEIDAEASLTDKWLGRLRGLPDGDDELYQLYRQHITKEMPDLGAQLPPTYDKAGLERVQQVGLTAKEYADLQRQALEFAAKGEWRQSTGAALATATTAEEWNEIQQGQRELGAPKAVLAMFGPWAPDAPARARQMAMTADQQSDAQTAATGQAITVRGQDLSASTARRGQDMSAATARAGQAVTMRGQDMTAATAANRLKAAVDENGNPVGLKLSAGQQQDLETMLTISDMAKEVRELGERTNWAGTGAFGAGTFGNLKSKLGRDTADNQSLRNKISNIKATLAKLRGGTAFTPNEQKLLDSYTPDINHGDADNQQKLVDLEAFVETKRRNMLKIASGDLSPNVPPAPITRGVNPFRK
jgi:hypothetical protein